MSLTDCDAPFWMAAARAATDRSEFRGLRTRAKVLQAVGEALGPRTVNQLATAAKCSTDRVRRALVKLQAQGLVDAAGPNNHRKYKLCGGPQPGVPASASVEAAAAGPAEPAPTRQGPLEQRKSA